MRRRASVSMGEELGGLGGAAGAAQEKDGTSQKKVQWGRDGCRLSPARVKARVEAEYWKTYHEPWAFGEVHFIEGEEVLPSAGPIGLFDSSALFLPGAQRAPSRLALARRKSSADPLSLGNYANTRHPASPVSSPAAAARRRASSDLPSLNCFTITRVASSPVTSPSPAARRTSPTDPLGLSCFTISRVASSPAASPYAPESPSIALQKVSPLVALQTPPPDTIEAKMARMNAQRPEPLSCFTAASPIQPLYRSGSPSGYKSSSRPATPTLRTTSGSNGSKAVNGSNGPSPARRAIHNLNALRATKSNGSNDGAARSKSSNDANGSSAASNGSSCCSTPKAASNAPCLTKMDTMRCCSLPAAPGDSAERRMQIESSVKRLSLPPREIRPPRSVSAERVPAPCFSGSFQLDSPEEQLKVRVELKRSDTIRHLRRSQRQEGEGEGAREGRKEGEGEGAREGRHEREGEGRQEGEASPLASMTSF